VDTEPFDGVAHLERNPDDEQSQFVASPAKQRGTGDDNREEHDETVGERPVERLAEFPVEGHNRHSRDKVGIREHRTDDDTERHDTEQFRWVLPARAGETGRSQREYHTAQRVHPRHRHGSTHLPRTATARSYHTLPTDYILLFSLCTDMYCFPRDALAQRRPALSNQRG